MNIATHIRNEIARTDNIIAMSNAFHTWDGNVDIDVIEQGMLERLSQFEAFEDRKLGIRLARETSNVTRIEIADMDSGEIIQTATVYLLTKAIVGLKDFFNYEELQTIADTLAVTKH